MGRGSSKASGLAGVENRIRGDKVETAALFGPNGKAIFEKSDGLPDKVSFTEEEAKLMVDGILTHNHPSGSTFSVADVDTAFTDGLREIRAVYNDGEYSLRRNFDIGDTIPQNYFDFAADYSAAIKKYKRSVVDAIYFKTGDVNIANKMYNDFRKDWLKANSSNYGWTYKEGKR